jgi:hypothetical protein
MSNSILDDITQALNNNKEAIGEVHVYAFGSLLKEGASPNDIDILAVYENAEQPSRIRSALTPLASSVPLHLTFMLPQEEAELDFISSQKCLRFYPQTAECSAMQYAICEV